MQRVFGARALSKGLWKRRQSSAFSTALLFDDTQIQVHISYMRLGGNYCYLYCFKKLISFDVVMMSSILVLTLIGDVNTYVEFTVPYLA